MMMDKQTTLPVAPKVLAELRQVRSVVRVPFWCRSIGEHRGFLINWHRLLD
uniref:Uncharacterized protein n=1 Tax=Helianthus annuus TaxID=4232 RepID=A0A251T4E5_HELAN